MLTPSPGVDSLRSRISLNRRRLDNITTAGFSQTTGGKLAFEIR